MTIQKCGNPSFGAKLVISEKLNQNGLVMRVKDRLSQTGGKDLAFDIYETKGGDINFVAKHLKANNIVLASCQVENEKAMATLVKNWAKNIPALVASETLRLTNKI